MSGKNMAIDPMEFGKVLARLDEQDRQMIEMEARQERQMTEMKADIRHLLDMAHQGKGALFVFMAIASVIGAIIGYVVSGRMLK